MTAVDDVEGRVFGTLLGALEASSVTLGHRLGLWLAVDGAGGPVTAAALASAAGIHPRYAREWLEAMGSAGYLVVADGSGDPAFSLAPGVREVLVDPDSGHNLMPMLRQSAAAAAALRPLEAAYRAGGGVGWAEFDIDMRDAQGDVNQLPLRTALAGWIREHLPTTAEKLSAGGRAADVGCGFGWATVGLAEGFPEATITAFDPDEYSASRAAENITEAGVAGRATVVTGPIEPDGPPFDLVVMAEMLHDVPDPVGVLAAAGARLAPGGVVLVADMKVADDYAAPGDEIDRLWYGFSLLVCLPDSMTARPSAATGTVFRAPLLRDYARRAGLDAVTVPVAHDFWTFHALTPAGR
ncbi:methyltransferase domain-containing protein [Nakamurella sp. YIM 132087]|uniref:Methyltransferase domain-containing protein n=1 Tax=Nakamurella alba TaxID=2665158 RepID=A0A7K1FP10_9ACTN|nr:class I SAM-dependent methyltransferase [Nakamurella alba]MTD15877.1 methyltransferase domain-containing protein [Nakamurella alba]